MPIEAWNDTDKAVKLYDKEKGYVLDRKLFLEQADKIRCDSAQSYDKPTRCMFIEMYTRSSMGLGVGAGPRAKSAQQRFRAETIIAYDAKISPTSSVLWCPVTHQFYPASALKAAHIFAYSHGQAFMSKIFGPEADNELFSVNNRILLLREVERLFDKGFLVIVPCIEDEKSAAQIDEWHASNPKRYKLRVIERNAAKLKYSLPGDEHATYIDLDGRELIFRSNHRPRARYLYFHYCVAILRRS